MKRKIREKAERVAEEAKRRNKEIIDADNKNRRLANDCLNEYNSSIRVNVSYYRREYYSNEEIKGFHGSAKSTALTKVQNRKKKPLIYVSPKIYLFFFVNSFQVNETLTGQI